MIRAGERLALKIEEFDLDLLVREIVDEFNVIYENRFVLVTDGPAPGFWSQSGIRRVIENLSTNAIKYSTPDTPITVTMRQTKSRVKVSVHNEGQAIPTAIQTQLFQAFRRAKTSEPKTGWGLGLTVVKGLTEAHHGTANVESAEGKGTTFAIELPRDARELIQPESLPRPGLQSKDQPNPLQSLP